MKKHLSLIVAIVLVLTIVPFSVFGVSAETDSQGLTFEFKDAFNAEDYYILAKCPTTATSVVIPETFNGYPVKEIKSDCFAACNNILSINIPASITRIQGAAISSCDSLVTLTVDTNNSVFYSKGNCIIEKDTGIISVGCKGSVIPTDASVTEIGSYAFYRCDGITKIVAEPTDEVGALYIPANITTIGRDAFSVCENLISAEFPDTLVSILGYAFQFCYNMESVDFGNGIKKIDLYCFNNCDALTEIYIPASVNYIGRYAFDDCPALTDIYFEADELPAELGTGWYDEAVVPEIHFGIKNEENDKPLVDGETLKISSYTVSDEAAWAPNADWAPVTADDGKRLTDGIKNTGALSPAVTGWYFGSAYPNGGKVEIVLDIEGLGMVSDVVGYFYNYAPDIYTSASEFIVEYSVDGKTYTAINATANKVALADSDYPNFAWVLSLDEAVVAGFIKVTLTGANNSLIITDEIEVYGTKYTAATGDVDASGEVDSADYLLIKRHCFSTYKFNNEEFARADVDSDNDINSQDYVIVKRMCFGTYTA